ncbi:MAG: FAD-binding oxidoreductase [Alphaproteobacteria bacterium]|nr:FAD-binding oxidoreductase [Alphaproteobacteria bacterium]
MKLSGWGRYPQADCVVLRPRAIKDLKDALAQGPVIARGMGRAYGDSALNKRATIDMARFNHMLAFDPVSGLLTVEAGVVLGDIIEVFLPRGWFPPVTPGTKFVTVGGMIAADVHGKNHHKHGSFGNFVEWLDVLGPDGEIRRCARAENNDLLAYTIGGMGLTGIILRVAFRMQPVATAWIRQETRPAANLAAAMAAFDAADEWTYSVAWIDCLSRGDQLGRSLLLLGEHAREDELDAERRGTPFSTPRKRKLNVPLDAPTWALNKWSVRAFNQLFYRNGVRASGQSLVDWESYFYPLDGVGNWNRIYGRRGFAQFQCVIPLANSQAGISALLREISGSGQGSFLAVLKRFGRQDSRFSFPMAGYTLALDFPVNPTTLSLLEKLDQITIEHGGRFYLAKDARMKRGTMEQADDRTAAFRTMREKTGVAPAFTSMQSDRLSL